MEKLARKITNAIQRENTELTDLQVRTIKYGLECLIGEITKMLIYVFLFSVFKVLDYFLVAAIFFCTLRIIAGGYHSKTYWRCFFTTLLIFTIIIIMGKSYTFPVNVKVYIILLSIILAVVFAPVDHPNKPIISQSRRLRLKYFSVAAICVMGAMSFLLPDIYSGTAVIAIFIEALTLFLGKLANRRRCA
ncbi:MAG: accessory gene regulator B family protein [Clostridiaceae bacterium]|nr:accessory gene regulator B family protein [Clostridiaceae bacterium]